MKPRNFMLTFLLLSIAAIATTAEAVSLADLQQVSLSNRQVVARYQANLEQARLQETRAKSGYYPSVDLAYTANKLDAAGSFEDEENSVAYGVVSWNLFAGLQDRYSIRSAGLMAEAETHRLQALRQDLQLQVALRYLAIFTRQANLQVAEDSHATLAKVYQDAESRFQVGLIQKNDLLKFKVDLDNAVITRTRAAAELTKSVQRLQREIEADVTLGQLEFAEFAQLPELQDQSGYTATMLANRSEIKVLEVIGRAADMQALATRSSYYPRIDLIGSYRRYDSDMITGNGSYDDDELRTQLVLSINLFDGFEKQARMAQAGSEARALRDDLAELQSELKTELANLLMDDAVNRDTVTVAESSIEQAKENVRITRLRYAEGLETEANLLDAIAALSRARSNLVVAKSEVFAVNFRITRTLEKF